MFFYNLSITLILIPYEPPFRDKLKCRSIIGLNQAALSPAQTICPLKDNTSQLERLGIELFWRKTQKKKCKAIILYKHSQITEKKYVHQYLSAQTQNNHHPQIPTLTLTPYLKHKPYKGWLHRIWSTQIRIKYSPLHLARSCFQSLTAQFDGLNFLGNRQVWSFQ